MTWLQQNGKQEFTTSGNNTTAEDLWVSLKSKFLYLNNQFVPKVKPSGNHWEPMTREVFHFKKQFSKLYTQNILHHHRMAAKTRGDEDAARLPYNNDARLPYNNDARLP